MTTRDNLYDALHKEIIGPGNTNPVYLFENDEEREILLARIHGAPSKRYGAGMLFPRGITEQLIDDRHSELETDIESLKTEESPLFEDAKNSTTNGSGSEDSSYVDDPVSLANAFKPSSLGITFRAKAGSSIKVFVKSAYYQSIGDFPISERNKEGNIITPIHKRGVNSGNPKMSSAWQRVPLNQFEVTELNLSLDWKRGEIEIKNDVLRKKDDDDWLGIKVFNRSTLEDKREGVLTITIVLENLLERNRSDRDFNDCILFQNELILKCEEKFYPLVEKKNFDSEVNQMNLLYRQNKGFAIGHGVAVEWNHHQTPTEIISSFLPKYELPVIGSNESSNLTLSMYEMSDKGDWKIALSQIGKLISEYERWIEELDGKINELGKDYYQEAAKANRNNCQEVLKRIKVGYDLLNDEKNIKIIKCFKWMNRAMVWQQQRSKTPLREWNRGRNGKFKLALINKKNTNFEELKEFAQKPTKGKWRPFQLAFVLMNLKSIVEPNSEDRKIVDLIWFPTGGGKTEAYLGLSAFNIFWRRLKGNEIGKNQVGGTSILMRYTLRLLTAQQFERASSLICACDLIRQEVNKEGNFHFHLGNESISIGLWVGGTTTPNDHNQALGQYTSLIAKINAPYNFVLLKCPCCGSQIGKKDGKNIIGLIKEGTNPIYFTCENKQCEYFKLELPVSVVDEYIYKNPPTLLLGTVDKFAMLPWKANKTGSLFGFRIDEDKNVSRILPPNLIIQDELHLISGPLGSLVGMYETIVQTLCNIYNSEEKSFLPSASNLNDYIPPKIVASTATISRAHEQIKALYATEKMCIFPPQAIDFGNTWFSEVFPKSEKRGRQYIGICTPGYPSPQTTIVRAYTSILQKAKLLIDNSDIDYYWTLLGYFNSIRELGGAVSLMDADIKERLGQIVNRELLIKEQRRFVNYKELTSRIPSSQIPQSLKKLEEKLDKDNEIKAIGACLATNMIATGVDISRFGLMFIHGQPKTTAEYIQASSRVGRDLGGPGFVVTIYNPSKPRDKSQYEHFQTYHSRIYGSVEPTSVTPFTINVRERALHAVLIGLVRFFTKNEKLRRSADTSYTDFAEVINKLKTIILERVRRINPEEEIDTKDYIEKKIIAIWDENFSDYGDAFNSKIKNGGNNDFTPLMFANSAEIPSYILNSNAFKTPTSMRGTDSESNLKPTI